MDDREPRKLGDPNYVLGDFKNELSDGGLKWLASVLGLLSAAALLAQFFGWWSLTIAWPIHLEGSAATALVIASFGFWSVLAVINWLAWFRSRSGVG